MNWPGRYTRRVKLVRHVERRLEQLVEGLAGKMFRGQMHPVELASRLIREADLAVSDDHPAGPAAPNAFEIRIAPELLTDELPAAFLQELARAVEDTAIERGWRLPGPVKITLLEDPNLTTGVKVATSSEPGPLRAWARLTGSDGSFDIGFNRSIIGRADAADVRIVDPHVSRAHAVLWRDGTGYWVDDLGSANGTKVDGRSVSGPAAVHNGSLVVFGRARLTFRVLSTV